MSISALDMEHCMQLTSPAHLLQETFMAACSLGQWNCRVEVGEGEGVIMHSPTSMLHYPASQFQAISHEKDYSQPRSVLRGFAEMELVEQGEGEMDG